MAYGYLKTPVEQHKDVAIAVKVIYCKKDKAMVHSTITDKTFEVDAKQIYFKNTPAVEPSEYVVDLPKKNNAIPGQDPVYPSKDYGNTGTNGISKRLYIATEIMQGLCSSLRVSMTKSIAKMYVSDAYMIADELLEKENK